MGCSCHCSEDWEGRKKKNAPKFRKRQRVIGCGRFFFLCMYVCTGFVSNSISIHPDGMHARVKRFRLTHHPMTAYSRSTSQDRPSQHITTTTEDSRNAAFCFDDFSSLFGERERQVRLRKEIKNFFPGREGGWGGQAGHVTAFGRGNFADEGRSGGISFRIRCRRRGRLGRWDPGCQWCRC